MTRLTPEANERMDQYLQQVRSTLSGCVSVNADEVERDIREHIESELPADQEAVPLPDLNRILDRLGSPSQWVPPSDLPWWRRFLNRWHHGPEDWRLAYLAFFLLVVGVWFAYALWLLVPVSYLVARAAVAAAHGRGEKLAAQRWFIYPSLLIIDLPLIALVLVAPLIPAVHIGRLHLSANPAAAVDSPPDFTSLPTSEMWVIACLMVGAAAIWWVVLGTILAIWPGSVHATLQPFGQWFKRKHAVILIGIGLGLGGVLAAALLGLGVTTGR